MCATSPIDCRKCGELLYITTGRRAECRNKHITAFESLSAPGHTVTGQYHGSGRSLAMLRTLCTQCRPV
jgi:hypothetical protein